MEPQCSARAEAWLSANTRLDEGQRIALAGAAADLLRLLPKHSPWLLTIGGLPGTGKSTLSGLLKHLLREGSGPGGSVPRTGQPFPTMILSLDDYYLPRERRARLAEERHPLLVQRGVPGTHDIDLLFDHVDRLLAGDGTELQLPRFDKGKDDRLREPRQWIAGPGPGNVILEGWFVGIGPEPEQALATPRTPVERAQDPNGDWRRFVNGCLGAFDERLQRRRPTRWYLAAPGWEQVVDWRWKQERDLEPHDRRLKDRRAVEAFLATFQRIALHQLETAAENMDCVIHLDRHHRPRLEFTT